MDLIPTELKQLPKWVCWKYKARPGKPKPAKLPIDCRSGNQIDITKCKLYSYEEAVAYHEANPNKAKGIGFVFKADDPFTGIDLDNCRDTTTGVIKDWAQGIIARLDSYSEVSPSQSGVKIFVRAKLGIISGTRKGNIEIYSDKRYFTVTGEKLPNSPSAVEDRQKELAQLYQDVFEDTKKESDVAAKWGAITLDDEEVIAKAMQASNGDKFARLWRGDTSGYSSASEADLALCSMLAYWVGGDSARVEALFNNSKLGQRDKWIDRADYRKRTIESALLKTPQPLMLIRGTKNNQMKQEETRRNKIVNTGCCWGGQIQILPAEIETKAIDIAESLSKELAKLPDWQAAFKLARKLQGLTMDYPPESFELAAKTFCERTARPYEDFYYAFLDCWEKVRIPEGQDALDRALELANQTPIQLDYCPQPSFLLVASIAWYLSELTADHAFWLPRVRLSKIASVKPITITRIVRRLEKRGIIHCTDEKFSYSKKEAKLYRWGPREPEAYSL